MKALVTGASSGIGRDISCYLASLGYDLFVVATDKEKLYKIYKDFKVKVVTLKFDLTKEEDCMELYKQLKDEKIDILVNNAGFGDSGNFIETSLEKELKMINLNIKAYHILTKLFLKDFVERDYGRILNVASIAGFLSGPYMATYYATKNYVVSLSEAIYEELKKDKSNVHISIFCPGPVDTNFSNVAKVDFKVKSISSEYAARYAVNNMFRNKFIIIPPNMKINYFLSKISPKELVLWINSYTQRRKKHVK